MSLPIVDNIQKLWPKKINYCIQTYLSFIQPKNPKIVCNPKVIIYSWFDHNIIQPCGSVSLTLEYVNYIFGPLEK